MEIAVQGSAVEIYEALRKIFEQYKADGKLEQLSNIEFNDQKCTAEAKGTGFRVDIACKDNLVKVDLDLNFLLRPMKGKIEEKIQKIVLRATQKT